MTQGSTIVLVHGIGGPSPTQDWLDPLDSTLVSLGFPTVSTSADTIVNLSYLGALEAGAEGPEVPTTWHAPDDRAQEANWLHHLERMGEWRDVVQDLRNDPRGADVGFAAGTPIPNRVAGLLGPVAQYRGSERHRHAAWRAVLSALPERGHVIVVAHSLGAVVMVDLLRRLPPGLTVDLLVTVGAPFAVSSLRRHNLDVHKPDRFPADRVRAWVNVFDPGDVVTVGRGAARHYPAALDVPVHTGDSHSLKAHLRHPVVAGLVAHAVFGARPSPADPRLPQRLLAGDWDGLLLKFAFSQQLLATCDTGKWRFRARLESIRRDQARRVLTQNRHAYEGLLRQLDTETEAEQQRLRGRVDDWAVAPPRRPSREDLLDHPAALQEGRYEPSDLVLVGVDMLMSNPMFPFTVELDRDHERAALARLFARIERPETTVAGDDVASEICHAVRHAQAVFDDGHFPWGAVLVGAGIALLAATGIGLAVAAPAGLAGAAVITSTLAAFGPGGMAGGVATLAALTGTAGAATAAGITIEAAGEHHVAAQRTLVATEVVQLPPEQLQTALAAVLAVLLAQRALRLPSDPDRVELLILEAQAVALAEWRTFKELTPDSPETKAWEKKVALLNRLLDWLREHRSEVGLPQLGSVEVRKAIEG